MISVLKGAAVYFLTIVNLKFLVITWRILMRLYRQRKIMSTKLWMKLKTGIVLPAVLRWLKIMLIENRIFRLMNAILAAENF